MARIGELALVCKSKNAGPFEVTIDAVFPDRETFDKVRASGVLCPELFARLYKVRPDEVVFTVYDAGLAFKATLPRLVPAGDVLVTNNPWWIMGHLNDVAVVSPLFHDGRLVTLLYLSGHHPNGEAFSDLMFVMGGMGARAGMDGLHTMSFPANSSNIPVEVLESVAPVRVRRKHLRADSGGAGRYRGGCGQVFDSGGAGRYRGGCGQVFEFESVSPRPIVARAEHGKLDTAPRGLRGGAGTGPGSDHRSAPSAAITSPARTRASRRGRSSR